MSGIDEFCEGFGESQLLVAAASGGHLELARWLSPGPRPAATSDAAALCALRAACSGGHSLTAQWVVERFALFGAASPNDSRRDGAAARRCAGVANALAAALRGGHLEVATWLAERGAAEGAEMRARLFDSAGRAVARACADGRLAVAQIWSQTKFATQWALSRWQLAVPCDVPAGRPLNAPSSVSVALMLRRACAGGRLGVARIWSRTEFAKQWIATFRVTRDTVRADRAAAFVGACAGGHLDVAEWLAATFGLSGPAGCTAGERNVALRAACAAGRSLTARWLVDAFGMTADDARGADEAPLGRFVEAAAPLGRFDADERAEAWPALDAVPAFAAACAGGHLDVAEWLAARFALNAADARASDGAAFRLACAGGHLAVAKWLAARFALSAADARGDAFVGACAGGHLSVAQIWSQAKFAKRWLAATFGVGAPRPAAGGGDPPVYLVKAFMGASYCGRPAVVRWLAARRALAALAGDAATWSCFNGDVATAAWLTARSRRQARADAVDALRWACSRGQTAAAQWLVRTWALTADDTRADDNEAFAVACRGGHTAAARWLAATLRLTTADIVGAAAAWPRARANVQRFLGQWHSRRAERV